MLLPMSLIETTDFGGKDDGFLVKTTDFWRGRQIFGKVDAIYDEVLSDFWR